MRATSFTGSGADLTILPAPIYLSSGNVGIGSTRPSVALDVVGSVNVSGTITTGNACSLRYWKMTGTTPTYSLTSTVEVNYPYPAGVIQANIVGVYGTFDGAWPFNMTRTVDTARVTWLYTGNQLAMGLGVSAFGASQRPFTVIIVTIA